MRIALLVVAIVVMFAAAVGLFVAALVGMFG